MITSRYENQLGGSHRDKLETRQKVTSKLNSVPVPRGELPFSTPILVHIKQIIADSRDLSR